MSRALSMITEWRFKTLDKYPNRIICDDGIIYNDKGKKLCPKPGKGKYLRTRMYKDKEEYYSWIHRMVAYCFLGDCKGLQVHHKDRDRRNNHWTNLQIMTREENLALRVYTKPDDCPF